MLVRIATDEDISAQIVQARRWARRGQRADALETLTSLAPLVGAETPDATLRECEQIARRLEARDLELHFALCRYFAAPGAREPHQAVTRAALAHPALAREGFRLHHQRARVSDWISITEADPHGRWPQLGVFGPSGPNRAFALDEVVPNGTRAVDRVRVTRIGRSMTVGKLEPPDLIAGTAHLVPALSVWDCSAALRWSGTSRPDVVSGSTAVLATPFKFSGYWHWIYEGLLPLLALERDGLLATLDHVLICLDGETPRHVVDSLRATGLARDNIEITAEPFDLVVERLVLTARSATGGMVDDLPPGAARPSPDAAMEEHAAALAELRMRMAVPNTPGRRRIYVSRSDAAKRRVSNEASLLEALHRRGFECMTLSDLPFEQQVALFREAGVVVGPHGAGLTNIAFSAAGTHVLELEQQADRRRYFERLAARTGARYTSVTCPPDPDAPQDMVVDVGEVLSVLDLLLDR